MTTRWPLPECTSVPKQALTAASCALFTASYYLCTVSWPTKHSSPVPAAASSPVPSVAKAPTQPALGSAPTGAAPAGAVDGARMGGWLPVVTGADPWEAPDGFSNSRADSLTFDRRGKAARFHRVTLLDRSDYFAISCYPICKLVEDDLEEVSGVVSEEQYLHEWRDGTYHCARCSWPLYHSKDKWEGPCPWPSWRKPMYKDSLKLYGVHHDEWAGPNGYNGYTCEVQEVYCGRCALFLGHQFADAVKKGDVAPDACWRH